LNGPEVVDIARDAIWVLVQVSAPVMIVGLAVGVVISLIQALTQVQEMTLTFIPKMLAVFASFVVFMPFMSSSMNGLMERVIARIVAIE
jgi:flagellar biosynthetic protein FliQ